MLHTFWSAKGGSGVTVTVAAYSAWLARRDGPTTVVDLCGDQPAALGLASHRGEGWTDWLAAPQGGRAALDRLVVPVDERLSLLPVGTGRPGPAERIADLVAALASRPRVVVDAGVPTSIPAGAGSHSSGRLPPGADEPFLAFTEAGRSTMVVRPCYLALRRAMAVRFHIDDLVVLTEPDRALSPRDVAEVLGSELAAVLAIEPRIARSVDAGTLVRRRHAEVDAAWAA